MFGIRNCSAIASIAVTAILALTSVSPSQATVYQVNEAVGLGNDHAFWLPTFNSWMGLGTSDFNIIGGTFEWDPSGGIGSIAKLRGTIVSQNDSGKKFDVFFDYAYRGLGAAGTGGPKCELGGGCGGAAYVNAGVVPADDWHYFDFLPNANIAEFVGLDDLAGLTMSATERPNPPGTMPFQFGICAGNKNCQLGASMWFGYEILTNTQNVRDKNGAILQIGASGYGDINIEIPEPGTLALFGLGLAGLGLARRRQGA